MARFGCRTLLRGVTNFSPIILVSRGLYRYPVKQIFLDNRIMNVMTIKNRTFTISLSKNTVYVEIEEDNRRLRLLLFNNLEIQCLAEWGERAVIVTSHDPVYETPHPLREPLRQMLSTDIFRICIPMFEFFKSNTN